MEKEPSFNPMMTIVPTAGVGVKSPKKGFILIVDDEKANVDVLSRYLSNNGYSIAQAYNGEEAMQKIMARRPDLVLLDVMMPVMDGLTLCERLRSDVTTRSLPVILLSARNTLEDRILGLQSGVDDYVGKPFDLQEVKVRLEGALQRRRWDLASQPLTHLPGSPAIEEEVWNRIRVGFPFAFAYLDIDHFKAYNDTYGYDAGDKAIKLLAGNLIDVVRTSPAKTAFAGHVGGDDFIFVSTPEHMQQVLPRLTEAFDRQRLDLYNPRDREKRSIENTSRQGVKKKFPLMTLSVAVVSNVTRRILHYARLAEITSELKSYVKSQDHQGRSLIVWDRRTDAPCPQDSGRPNDE